MATKTLYFPDIKNGWYVTFFCQTRASYDYEIELKDPMNSYINWGKPFDGYGHLKSHTQSFLYTGEDGALVCIIHCPLSPRLDNTWSESIITPSSGEPTLGRTYSAAFEDNGGKIVYRNLLINLSGWAY